MAFASFGVITPVLSVVISVFMFGLFGGSWLAGKTIVPLTAKTGRSAIWYYAVAELMIGVGAFAVPKLLGMDRLFQRLRLEPLEVHSAVGLEFCSKPWDDPRRLRSHPGILLTCNGSSLRA
jgi:cytochrome bd-type quinol oxidase subunit 2